MAWTSTPSWGSRTVPDGQDSISDFEIFKGSDFDDTIRGGQTDNDANLRMQGRGGDDELIGTNSSNVLKGGGGNDVIRAGGGDDDALGGAGDDLVQGGSGDDVMKGGKGDDTVSGARASTPARASRPAGVASTERLSQATRQQTDRPPKGGRFRFSGKAIDRRRRAATGAGVDRACSNLHRRSGDLVGS